MRIPYETWINSQLSIARHYGGITLNGESYVFDPASEDKDGWNRPDLVTMDEVKKYKKEKKQTKKEQTKLL